MIFSFKNQLVFCLLLFLVGSPLFSQEPIEKDLPLYKMKEHNTNYFITGYPDTKIQFSFKFRLLKNYNYNFAFTQIMFWDLGKKDSNPFSELNYNPEFFYELLSEGKNAYFTSVEMGYSHLSNGKSGEESRSIEALYLQFVNQESFPFGVPRVHLRLRAFFGHDKTNRDLQDYYGPIVLKIFFTKLGESFFASEESYFEFYNGGKFANDFTRSSFLLSFRFKFWDSSAGPKIFLQYFNGYGENLATYNKHSEVYRVGLSIGGF